MMNTEAKKPKDGVLTPEDKARLVKLREEMLARFYEMRLILTRYFANPPQKLNLSLEERFYGWDMCIAQVECTSGGCGVHDAESGTSYMW
jgi:hypothetical protein